MYLILYQTILGYEIRTVGLGSKAAKHGGINSVLNTEENKATNAKNDLDMASIISNLFMRNDKIIKYEWTNFLH